MPAPDEFDARHAVPVGPGHPDRTNQETAAPETTPTSEAQADAIAASDADVAAGAMTASDADGAGEVVAAGDADTTAEAAAAPPTTAPPTTTPETPGPNAGNPPVVASSGPGTAGTSTTAAVEMTGVTRMFDELAAVDDLSLVVERGTILGLIGPSGAGKTTTIRMLTGMLAPSRGQVRVLGEDPRRFKRGTRERIGYMPQSFVLYPDLTTEENVDFVASLFGMLWFRRRRRIRQVLELLELTHARKRQASQLSGGMQRRLGLACALVHDPTLLFLDEPTAGIDPILRQTVWDELERLRDTGRTLLVTTQYVADAERCDSVALIANGRLAALGPPEALRREALGGDVVELETTGTWDGEVLRRIPMVRGLRQIGPRQVLVTADDAGAVTPAIVDAVHDGGGEVAAVREYRPAFDEVFAELVDRDGRSGEPEPDALQGFVGGAGGRFARWRKAP